MLHTATRILPFSLRMCLRQVSQQQLCNNKALVLSYSGNHVCNAVHTLSTPGHICSSMTKHQLVVSHRKSSDDSTSDKGIPNSGPRNESSKDSNDNIVDFNEMLENIRKLRTQEDGDIKSIYTGKKKYRVSDEERRTQPMSIEELVDFLTMLNGIDICVIRVDPALNYVIYLVTVTGVSTRHLLSMAKSLVYECKRIPSMMTGKGIHIEGIESEDWMAVNLGDTVVHFMLQTQRDRLELEKLWSLGHEYDDQYKLLESQLNFD